jgi:hypothetical protein
MHSPWISRLLSGLGHEVIVAHARNVRLIGESRRKDDRLDAQTLARLARIDPPSANRWPSRLLRTTLGEPPLPWPGIPPDSDGDDRRNRRPAAIAPGAGDLA